MSNRLANLRPAPGSVHRKQRIARGIGSGTGKTAGRGHKGQNAHGGVRPGFEGGQTPLARRIPHLRGFRPHNRKEYAIVNVARLVMFDANTEVTPEALLEAGLIDDVMSGVKILGTGELDRPLVVRAHKFSASAQEKIRQAGGSAEVIPVRAGRGQPEAEA